MTKGLFVKKDGRKKSKSRRRRKGKSGSNGRGDLCAKHAHALLGKR